MKPNDSIHNERGTAMVLDLLMLTVMTLPATLFMAQTKTETQIAGHDQRATQALFNAEAGYGEILARMSNPMDVTNYMGPAQGAWTTNPGWGRYVVMANGNSTRDPNRAETLTDNLDNDGDGTVDENDEYFPEIATAKGANPINYPWAKGRYNRNAAGKVLLFGDHDSDITTAPAFNLNNGWPVLIVNAEGNRGTAQRRVEVEAVKFPFDVPNAAIYAEDDDFKFNGTQFEISGEDHDPVTQSAIPGGTQVPGIATTMDPTKISGELKSNQINNVNGVGAEPSVSPATVDIDMQAMRDQFAPMATRTLAAGTYSNVNWGDLNNYGITHITGDLHGSGLVEGGGLLIVDGDFNCSGQLLWYGLVLVLGDITFTGGGAGIHIFGSVMVQGGVSNPGVGGNADIVFSSEALGRLAQFMPYVVYNWREQ